MIKKYVRQGDYYIPNLVLPKQKKIHLNKYGRMRLNYLKEHKKPEYTIMFMENTLIDHLEEIQETSTKRVNHIKWINICMKFLKTNEKFGNKCYNINQWKQN